MCPQILSRPRRALICMLSVLAAVAWAFGVLGSALARQQQAANSHIIVDLPNGYAPSALFSGFEHAELGISILVQEMPRAAFDDLAKGLTPQRLANQGIHEVMFSKLARKDEHIFMRGQQNSAAGNYAKFFMVFQEAKLTILLSANVPRQVIDQDAARADQIEAILASASIAEKVAPRELYRLERPGPFQAAGTFLGTATLYTRDGRMEATPKGAARSIFIVAPSLDHRPIADLVPFSQQLLYSLAGYRDLKLGSSTPVHIGGLDGVAMEADAVHRSDGVPVRVFQMVLTPAKGGYIRLVGIARADEAAALFPEFREMAQSFRLIGGP